MRPVIGSVRAVSLSTTGGELSTLMAADTMKLVKPTQSVATTVTKYRVPLTRARGSVTLHSTTESSNSKSLDNCLPLPLSLPLPVSPLPLPVSPLPPPTSSLAIAAMVASRQRRLASLQAIRSAAYSAWLMAVSEKCESSVSVHSARSAAPGTVPIAHTVECRAPGGASKHSQVAVRLSATRVYSVPSSS